MIGTPVKQGPQGVPGAKGAKGDTGPVGATGPAGVVATSGTAPLNLHYDAPSQSITGSIASNSFDTYGAAATVQTNLNTASSSFTNALAAHVANTSNPHATTAAQTGALPLTGGPGGMSVTTLAGGAFINLGSAGASGIGPSTNNPFVAYCFGNGYFFTNAIAGDVAYRNTGGRLLFGGTNLEWQLALSSSEFIIATPLRVQADADFGGCAINSVSSMSLAAGGYFDGYALQFNNGPSVQDDGNGGITISDSYGNQLNWNPINGYGLNVGGSSIFIDGGGQLILSGAGNVFGDGNGGITIADTNQNTVLNLYGGTASVNGNDVLLNNAFDHLEFITGDALTVSGDGSLYFNNNLVLSPPPDGVYSGAFTDGEGRTVYVSNGIIVSRSGDGGGE